MEKEDIVCFGDSDWWYHNRGHMDLQLMRRFARSHRVLYVNSIVVRKFNIQEGTMFLRRVKRKLRSIMQGMKSSGIKNMTVCSPFTMPVHHIFGARQINEIVLRHQVSRCMRKLNIQNATLWVACPAAAQTAVKLPHAKLVYQRSDCYEQLPGVDADRIRRYDWLLKKHADVVIYVNKQLIAAEKPQCRRAIYLGHGVDYDIFADTHQDNKVPEEMTRIPHPILGFYGSIDNHTSNINLVAEVADLLPHVSVVLIGNSSVDLSDLAARKNVFLLSQKPYEQIPHYAKCFDVCFMAWRQNEWINACNPVKLKEYLALGKPIVSTPFSELSGYKDLVEVASDAKSFAQAVSRACDENDPKLVSARRKRVRGCTWDAKAAEVFAALNEIN